MKKGDIIELGIEKIVFGGEAFGYYEGKVVFVPFSIPGDLVSVEIISTKKDYSRGLITKIIKPSQNRIAPECRYFNDCGGCDYMMAGYESQLNYKKEIVRDVMKRIGKTEDFQLFDVKGMEKPGLYRNKVIQPFGKEKGKVISGFYRKMSHDIVDIEYCMIQSEISNKIIKKIKEILDKNCISIYEEGLHTGVLRNIMVRTNTKNEAMIVFVINAEKIKNIESIIGEITSEIKEVKSIYMSINKERTNLVLGRKNILLYGEKVIYENYGNLQFAISPLSFFQVNTEQAKYLYDTAVDYLTEGTNGKLTIVDAYSGTGTIGMIAAGKAEKVICIETVHSAVEDAVYSAKMNRITNMVFVEGLVEEKLEEIIDGGTKIDGIIFDPPRKGIEEKVLHKIKSAGIRNIVYISCNPSTFARDCAILKKLGYRLEKLQPVDMFPHTHHIELVGKITLGGDNEF